MKQAVAIFCLFAAISTGGSAQQGSPSKWDKYVPRTLQSIIDAHQEGTAELDRSAPNAEKQIVLTSDSFPSRVTLVFLGQSRPLPNQHATLLQDWARMLSRTDDLVDLFGTEMLFKEGDKEFWIPVQKPLLSYISKEVPVGTPFTAYMVWIGAIKTDGQWDWLFAMNEFDTPESNLPSQKADQ